MARPAGDEEDNDVRTNDAPPRERVTHETTSNSIQTELLTPAICVICLERVPDKATVQPCRHDQFHFSCLGTWLHRSRVCPLCKARVQSIQYSDESHGPLRIFCLSNHKPVPGQSGRFGESRRCEGAGRAETRALEAPLPLDEAVAFRRRVYELKLYSLYIGSNKVTGYRNISPTLITREPSLVTKAKKWIRRELRVFDFLNPNSSSFGRSDRRATNAEYLLEYIVAVLRSIDLKGSAGQAEELLKDFLGRDNARLFLHELEAWLRSPYDSIAEWDRATQYPEPQQ